MKKCVKQPRPTLQFVAMPSSPSAPLTTDSKQFTATTVYDAKELLAEATRKFSGRRGRDSGAIKTRIRVGHCLVCIAVLRDLDQYRIEHAYSLVTLILEIAQRSGYVLPRELNIYLIDRPQMKANGCFFMDPSCGIGTIIVYKERKLLHILAHEMFHWLYEACLTNAYAFRECAKTMVPEEYQAAERGEPFDILGNHISTKNYPRSKFIEELVCEIMAHWSATNLLYTLRDRRRLRKETRCGRTD